MSTQAAPAKTAFFDLVESFKGKSTDTQSAIKRAAKEFPAKYRAMIIEENPRASKAVIDKAMADFIPFE